MNSKKTKTIHTKTMKHVIHYKCEYNTLSFLYKQR